MVKPKKEIITGVIIIISESFLCIFISLTYVYVLSLFFIFKNAWVPVLYADTRFVCYTLLSELIIKNIAHDVSVTDMKPL